MGCVIRIKNHCCSVHVGETIGSKLQWPQYDPEGYRVVEQTMIKFGMKVFCKVPSIN